MGYYLDYHWLGIAWIAPFAQGAQSPIESPWVKVILAVVALAFLAMKITESVIRWRRDSGAPQPDVFQAKVLEDLKAIREIVARENMVTGQKRIYVPMDLETKLEMLREIRAQTGEILRLLDDITNRSGVWSGPTNPGG